MSDDEKAAGIKKDVDAGVPYQEIAKKWHVSPKTIKKIKDEAGNKPSETDGEIAARAFQLFGKGKKPHQAVMILKLPPETVMELYNRWVDMTGKMLVSKADVNEIFDKIGGVTLANRNVKTLKEKIASLMAYYQRTLVSCPICEQLIRVGDEPWYTRIHAMGLVHPACNW